MFGFRELFKAFSSNRAQFDKSPQAMARAYVEGKEHFVTRVNAHVHTHLYKHVHVCVLHVVQYINNYTCNA